MNVPDNVRARAADLEPLIQQGEARVYIMRGIQGIGKSHMAKRLISRGGKIVSADHFFERGGEYHFAPEDLSKAHAQCFREAVDYVTARPAGSPPLVVDNTNLTAVEVAPYVLLAQAYGLTPILLCVNTTYDFLARQCAERNTHGVPVDRVMRAWERFTDAASDIPPWWTQIHFTPAV